MKEQVAIIKVKNPYFWNYTQKEYPMAGVILNETEKALKFTPIIQNSPDSSFGQNLGVSWLSKDFDWKPKKSLEVVKRFGFPIYRHNTDLYFGKEEDFEAERLRVTEDDLSDFLTEGGIKELERIKEGREKRKKRVLELRKKLGNEWVKNQEVTSDD